MQEHPTQFLSDMVGIVASIVSPGAGVGIKAGKATDLVTKLNASKHLAAKTIRGAARVGEVAIDPASAIGRASARPLAATGRFIADKIKTKQQPRGADYPPRDRVADWIEGGVGSKHKLSDAVTGYDGKAYASNVFPDNQKLSGIATTVQKSIMDGTPPNKISKVIDDEINRKNKTTPGFYNLDEIRQLKAYGEILSKFKSGYKLKFKQWTIKGAKL